MSLRDVIANRVEKGGPLPFAEYMDLALYHPEYGYYARADRRSGRAGDFFTSVDIGTRFGELLSRQFAEMGRYVRDAGTRQDSVQIVEAGAGSGRLARDILDAARLTDPAFYESVLFTLVERSPTACAAQTRTLTAHATKVSSGAKLPERVHGIVFANELLDALPTHPVVMTDGGLKEVFVDVEDGAFVERLGTPTPDVTAHVARFGIRLGIGFRAEVSPSTVTWIREAADSLDRGFLVLVDYGHEADELYSVTHATGTLSCYGSHVVRATGDGSTGAPWLEAPGEVDITAHVDLSAVRATAEAAGLTTLGIIDQTYFLLSLLEDGEEPSNGADDLEAVKRRLALKTLLVPGGLGSTHKVMIFGKNMGTPTLQGCAFSGRLT